jgi:CheY-like chemotaxis protein
MALNRIFGRLFGRQAPGLLRALHQIVPEKILEDQISELSDWREIVGELSKKLQVSEQALWFRISDEMGIPFIEKVPPCNLGGLPKHINAEALRAAGCLPLQKNGRIVSLICVDPKRIGRLGLSVAPSKYILATWGEIKNAIVESESIFAQIQRQSVEIKSELNGRSLNLALEILGKIILEVVEESANEVVFEFLSDKISYSYQSNLSKLKIGEVDVRVSPELLKLFNQRLDGSLSSLPFGIVPSVDFVVGPTTRVRLSWSREGSSPRSMNAAPLIVVIDDNPVFTTVISRFLRSNNFSCEVFSKARQAISWISEQPGRVGAVICDMRMPEVDGLRFLKESKADPRLRSIPVIALTSDKDSNLELEALRLGVDAFVTKDEDPQLVLLHVKRLTNRLEVA